MLDDILINQHRRSLCYFQACCFFASEYTQVLFLHFAVKIDLKGAATCLLMVFHAILRQILKYRLCAISLREHSVCTIFLHF